MNTTVRKQRANRAPRQNIAAVAITFFATLLSLPGHASLVIPAIPLQSGTPLAPNILFILDDSGSMEQADMRNQDISEIRTARGANNNRLSLSSAERNTAYTYNTLYYNPHTTYNPWKRADGSYTAAVTAGSTWSDPNLTVAVPAYTGAPATTASGKINLTGNSRRFYVPNDNITDLGDLAQYKYYELTAGGTTANRCVPQLDAASNWEWSCAAVTSFSWTTADGTVTRDIAQEWQNYATWYGYHRTRMKAAKAGASYAFSDLGENYRVGYRSIWQRRSLDIPVGTAGGLFKDVTTPATSNRTTWFDRLFSANGSGYTPLQGALQNAGEYFSQTGASGPWGPGTGTEQLACRQNFAILTTDGYWNDQSNFTSTGVGNVDNTDGPTITGPNSQSYTYDNVAPYADGHSNTLGDIAMKYWKTDLRAGLNGLDNIVPKSTTNPAFWQHMVTFGISIGLKGNVVPSTVGASTTWGDPGGDNDIPAKIDDLLHAAVNGRGKFVAATNPDAFTQGLRAALSAIDEAASSASNVTFNSASLTAGSKSFVANYVSGVWTGDVKAYAVTSSGVSATSLWSAAAATSIPATRTILTHSGTNNALPVAFPTTTQETTLTTAIANYVKGSRTGEGTLYRTRTSLFGDIVNSSPVYVKEDTTETVYVGANDGMLHAIDATNGQELFTYVPNLIDMNQLKELSRPVDFVHKYYVDGPIVVSDRSTQTPGKNILVGTLGRGGKGVFGLDVTTPGTFVTTGKSWEYSGDADMGQVIGKPLIVKLNDALGTMAVVVSNGINSTNDRAALFVLNLETGALIQKITTNAETENALSMPTALDTDGNGTADVMYAGDLQGNVWKFDLSSASSGSWSSSKLFTATDPVTTTKRQPITGGITVAYNPASFNPWIFFGTGRYLVDTDPADKSVQSWYGIEDNGTAVPGRADPSGVIKVRQIKLAGTLSTTDPVTKAVTTTDVRAFEESVTGDMLNKRGWVVDLKRPPAPGTAEGERMIGDQFVVAGSVLVAASVIPGNNGCTPGGEGFLNLIDAFTGTAVKSPFIDANRDGIIDAEDTLPSDTNGDGTTDDTTPVGSINLNIGLITDPAALIGIGGTAQFCANGTTGVPGCVPFTWGPGFGRISWREILRD